MRWPRRTARTSVLFLSPVPPAFFSIPIPRPLFHTQPPKAPAAFDATQYSFFDLGGSAGGGGGLGDDGGLGDGDDGGLGGSGDDGGIEAGVDAPPEEEALGEDGPVGSDELDLVDDDADISLDDVTDLSYAAMFAAGMAAAGLGGGDDAGAGVGGPSTDSGFHLPNLLMADEPAASSRPRAPPPLGAGAGLLGAGSRLEPVPPPVLRGLPAGAPLSVYAAALRSAAGGGAAFASPPPPPQPHRPVPVSASDLEAQMRARAAAAAGGPPPPRGPPPSLSAAEVEARMRGQAAAAAAAVAAPRGPPQAPSPPHGYAHAPPHPGYVGGGQVYPQGGRGGPMPMPPPPPPPGGNVWAARAAAAAAAGRGGPGPQHPHGPPPGAPGGPRVVLVRGPPPGVGGRGGPYPGGRGGPPFPGRGAPYGGGRGGPPFQGPPAHFHHPPPHHPPPQQQPLSTVARRRLHGSSAMAPDEVDSILRAQWRAVHGGPPYVEDYLYQARVHAAGPAAVRAAHARPFAPEALREDDGFGSLADGDAPSYHACVRLEGLGRITVPNLRRPRPLMDLGGGPPALPQPSAGSKGEGDPVPSSALSPPGTPSAPAPPRRRLADEPRLAARLVVEECAVRALDVDDVDRLWAVSQHFPHQHEEASWDAPPRPAGPALAARRSALMASIAASMRLPEAAAPAAGGGGGGDAVFCRLMALPKGRSALAHALRLLNAPLAWGAGAGGPPSPPPFTLLWATLRNAADLFAEPEREGEGAGAAARERAEVEATASVAGAAASVARRLPDAAALCDALDALSKGTLGERAAAAASPADALLPLLPPASGVEGGGGSSTSAAAAAAPPASARPWLSDVLCAVLLRAQEVGLAGVGSEAPSGPGAPTADDKARWAGSVGGLWALLAKHVDTLAAVHDMALAAGASEAAEYARRVVPVDLIRTALPHAGEEVAAAVKAGMAKLK